ncbi:MAG: DUF4192 domain-containing protein [Candidatus Nanopelagicales bacterium]|nr:DUF4192 domain-containing protein [Candidatus Nanopelagicales bacterium]
MTNTRGRTPAHSSAFSSPTGGFTELAVGSGSDSDAEARTVKLRSSAAVAATIPYMLGFVPADSIVSTFFDRHGRLRLSARFDLPKRGGDLGSVAEVISRELARCEGVSMHLATFSDDEELCGDVLDALSELCRRRDIELLGAGMVAGNRWKSLTAAGCVESDGEPLTEGDPLDAACSMVLAGRSFVADRSDIEELVTGVEEVREAVQVELAQLRGRGDRRSTQSSGDSADDAQRRLEMEESIVGYLCGQRHAPEAPELADWAVSFRDSRLREPVLWCLSPAAPGEHEDLSVDDIISAWSWWVRATPSDAVAPVVAAMAAFAWQSGNGVLAAIAAEYALECDPASRLGRLVSRAVSASTPPAVWIDLMRSMTVEELRGCRWP